MDTAKTPLAEWMHASNTDAAVIAKPCGVSPTAVRGWARGDYNPLFEAAVTIEFMSSGAVPIESFGFSTEILRTARDVENRRRKTLSK